MSSKKANSKFTEDWIPVRNITNGMIELENKLKVAGVKIRPKNIFILDNNSRNNTIVMLKTFYDTIDFDFWLMSIDRPVDVSNYLATLQLQYNEVNDPRIKKIISEDIEKVNDFILNNVTDIEYYILFKDKNPDIIQKKLRTLMIGLSNAGLDSVQASNQDLRVVLESFLNGGLRTERKGVLPREF